MENCAKLIIYFDWGAGPEIFVITEPKLVQVTVQPTVMSDGRSATKWGSYR